MKDPLDHKTEDIFEQPPRKRGRPRSPNAKSDAQRQRECRERKTQRLAMLQGSDLPLTSDIICLDEVPIWKRA